MHDVTEEIAPYLGIEFFLPVMQGLANDTFFTKSDFFLRGCVFQHGRNWPISRDRLDSDD